MEEIQKKRSSAAQIFNLRIKGQADLLQLARKERNKWKQLKLESFHYRYLWNFFKQNRALIIGLLLLLLSQGVIESGLVIFSRNKLSGTLQLLVANSFWIFCGIGLILFLLNSFFSIKYERVLLVVLANNIRRRLFRAYIGQASRKASHDRQADLIAKISYQLSLVSVGVANTFFGLWRWLVYLVIVGIIAFMSNLNVWFICGIFLVVSLILFVSAYIFSRLYVSQEVTFYSRIIREIDFNASNINFLKIFGHEGSILKKFDKLVLLDSFFRVRRDLLIRLSSKVVFLILISTSLIIHFFPDAFYSWVGFRSLGNQLLFLFLIIYFSRALYESTKIGLYTFPARLGLYLTILKPGVTVFKNKDFTIRNKALTFYSQKVKFFKEGTYYRNLRLVFSSGERALFSGNNLCGKTAIAKTLAGIETYNHYAIKVIVDKERLEYKDWEKNCTESYFIDPNMRTDRSLMEFLLGKNKEDISADESAKALSVINKYSWLVKLISSDSNYNVSAMETLSNPSRSFALQALHCLVNNVYLIVIDNFWLDLAYDDIIKAIKTLNQELLAASIVIFSSKENNYLNYNKRYEITKEIKLVSKA